MPVRHSRRLLFKGAPEAVFGRDEQRDNDDEDDEMMMMMIMMMILIGVMIDDGCC